MTAAPKPALTPDQLIIVRAARRALADAGTPGWDDRMPQLLGRLEAVTGQLLELAGELASEPTDGPEPDASTFKCCDTPMPWPARTTRHARTAAPSGSASR